MNVPLVLLSTVLLSACAKNSQADAISACAKAISLGEKYASTMSVITSEKRQQSKSLDQMTSVLFGDLITDELKISFADVSKEVADAAPANLENLTEYPNGDTGEQAKLLKLIVDKLAAAPDPGVMTVEMSYDVDNGNGVPERKSGSCDFLLADTNSAVPLISYSSALRLEQLRQKSFGPVDVPNKGYKCCSPDFALAKIDPEFGRPVKGGVLMGDEIERAVKLARAAMKSGTQ